MAVHYDELWKNIIEKLFPHFLLYFMPELYADADLTLGYDFLDKELQKIKVKGRRGKKYADKLVKIRLKDGAEKWLLIHVEVQGKHEEDFGARMFRYFYRLYDKYAVDLAALAIFTYKTAHKYDFHYGVYGTTLAYRYNTACVANYAEEELLDSRNPFALVCLAVQYDNLYRNDEEQKFKLKRKLISMLRARDYLKEEIIELFEFIDDALYLTDTMKNSILDDEVISILEEEIPMAYISGFRQRAMAEGETKGMIEGETKGMMKGLVEGIQGMLEIKFGNVPSDLQHKISAISDLAKLESLKDGIKRATDYEQVQKML